MISLNIGNNFEIKPDALPKSWVFYTLEAEGDHLYAGYTARLGAKLNGFQQRMKDDPLIREMCQRAHILRYQPYPQAIQALAAFKVFVHQHSPEYQSRIHPFAGYVYLALDAARFPFITIQENTNDDWQYLGPFRSRFMLVDLIDSLSRILRLPYCETGSYPCDKFDRGACRGWCLALAPAKESKLEHDLQKLEALLKEAFLHPNNGILDLVQKERDNYFDNLDFAKADLLDDELDLLAKYRDWLNFLYVAKNLSFSNEQYEIEAGQLRSVLIDGYTHYFNLDQPVYRENESLALPLATVDEMKTIYDYIREQSHA
ncbi:MAG: hypothetical protein PHU99_00790 [Candidatus Cloacimonetes bacterium]|nr:hypothetical protein [Candidatus Cloacimonadota bacterium]MDD3096243.1 hypothetical protein [Candidatus Cloacimonadota bacterium]HPF08675.1 hypothetical protein [Candidatus Cloacimonadota bacterium]